MKNAILTTIGIMGSFIASLIDGNVYSPEAYPAGWAVYAE